MMQKGIRRPFKITVFLFFLFLSVMHLPATGNAGYFSPLDLTANNSVTDYYVNFKINGVAAQPGDEIAFFNPRGVISGLHVVTVLQDMYLVTVYGDSTATDGEILTVKVWDADRRVELSGNDLQLTSGIFYDIKPSLIPPVWKYQDSFVLNIDTATDTATHFPQPAGKNPIVTDYLGKLIIKGQPADIGDEVAVFDGNNVLSGSFRVIMPGEYGILSVYGDDPNTANDEGATEGEILTFKVWDQSAGIAGIEYSGDVVSFSFGEQMGSFVPSDTPLWSYTPEISGYALDIAVVGNVPPIGTIVINDGSGATNTSAVVLALSASDEDGVAKMRFFEDGTSWTLPEDFAATKEWTLTGGDGIRTVYVQFQDATDIWSSSFSDTIILDTTAPVLSLSTLPDGSFTNNDTLNISGTVSDATTGITALTVNGTSQVVENGMFSLSLLLTGGANTITITATDEAGNQATDIRTIYLDLTAPVLTINAPADNSKTNIQELTVTGSIDDAYLVEIALNGGAAQPAVISGNDFSLSMMLAYGMNSLAVTARDQAGNQITENRTVIYDDQAPLLSVIRPNHNFNTNQDTVVVEGTVTDITQVTLTVQDGVNTFHPTPTDGSFSQEVTLTAEGTYVITVTAVDELGNEASVELNIFYDKTPPFFSLDPVASYTTETTLTLTGNRETDAEITVQSIPLLTGTVSYPTETTWAATLYNLSLGNNEIILTARDKAGNETVIRVVVTYRLVAPGDVNNDKRVDLADAVLTMHLLSDQMPPQPISREADVNNDIIIGLEEIIYILQKIAELR